MLIHGSRARWLMWGIKQGVNITVFFFTVQQLTAAWSCQAPLKEQWSQWPGSSTTSQHGGPQAGAEGFSCCKVTGFGLAQQDHEWSGIPRLIVGLLPPLLHVLSWWGRLLLCLGGQHLSWGSGWHKGSSPWRHKAPHFPITFPLSRTSFRQSHARHSCAYGHNVPRRLKEGENSASSLHRTKNKNSFTLKSAKKTFQNHMHKLRK